MATVSANLCMGKGKNMIIFHLELLVKIATNLSKMKTFSKKLMLLMVFHKLLSLAVLWMVILEKVILEKAMMKSTVRMYMSRGSKKYYLEQLGN